MRYPACSLKCGLTFTWLTLGLLASQTLAAGPEIEIREEVEYGVGGEEKLYLDLARPTSAASPTPALVFIHGGGWAGGNRSAFAGAIKGAAAQGYLAVTISYRFAPKHCFPAQIEDCKCAVRYLRAHAKELNIDPERIGAVGISAGGHLSMMLGVLDTNDGLEGEGGWSDQSSKVQAVVSYVGPTNFEMPYPDASRRIVEAFLGGPREQSLETYRKASPITYVDDSDAPMLLFQGTVDPLVPWEQAFEMAAALTKARVPGRVELLLGHGHVWGGAEADRTSRAAMDFFRVWLKEKKEVSKSN